MKLGISILKRFSGYEWVNAYRVDAEDFAAGVSAANALANYERAFHLDAVAFISYRVWALNSVDPNDFVTGNLSGAGQRAVVFDKYPPPFVALHVRLATGQGRPGKKLYRYAMSQDDVKGVGDKAELDAGFGATSGWTPAVTTLNTELVNVGAPLHIGGNASGVGSRAVTSYAIGGAVQLDVRHGWYNQTP